MSLFAPLTTVAVSPTQNVLSEDFKAHEIEVGMVRGDQAGGAFRLLSVAEFEEHLTAISELD